MAKQGFSGQWVQIARVGKFKDAKGVVRDLTPELLQQAVQNFNESDIEAPLTIGHPAKGDPAYGWIDKVRMNGGAVEMQARDTADEFEQIVKDGRYRNRSAGIYLSHPSMKSPIFDHVAFLGAEKPAVKGLKPIQFSDPSEGDSFAVEFTDTQETPMTDKDFDQLPESAWEKIKAKLGITPAAAAKTELTEGDKPVAFTEADAKRIADEAANAVRTEFTEKLKEKDTEIAKLTERVDGQASGTKRSEIVAFVEGLKGGWKHYLKRAGVVEFLESLAAADDKDAAPAIVTFAEGKDGEKQEVKTSRLDWGKTLLSALPEMVEFGEKFGNITATAEADAVLPGRVEELKGKMGIKAKEGDK